MKQLARKIDWHHVAMQGTFFIGFGALWSYGAVLMLSRGLSNSAFGAVTCIAQLLPMLLQPMVAGLTEKYERLTPRRMILILGTVVFAAAVVMLCFSKALWVIIIGFILYSRKFKIDEKMYAEILSDLEERAKSEESSEPADEPEIEVEVYEVQS